MLLMMEANSKRLNTYAVGKGIIQKMMVTSEVLPKKLPPHFRDWMEMFVMACARAYHKYQDAMDVGFSVTRGDKAGWEQRMQQEETGEEASPWGSATTATKQGGGGNHGGGGGGGGGGKKPYEKPPASTEAPDSPVPPVKRVVCSGCGWDHGGECGMEGVHPDYNSRSNITFKDLQAYARGGEADTKDGTALRGV